MNNKVIYLYFILSLSISILIAPLANAQEKDYPNLSISSTYVYSLDSENNCELNVIINYMNLDDDFQWNKNNYIIIPIYITSFSKEQPTVTFVDFLYKPVNYKVINYNLILSEGLYYGHYFEIEFYPPAGIFRKGGVVDIKAKIKINGASLQIEDYNQFNLHSWPIPKNTSDLVIRVNLPNNPYYWSELLDTTKYDYRSIFGRGESIEWWHNGTETLTDNIVVDYRIHPDPLREDLDNATFSSLEYAEKADYYGYIALIIAIISIPSAIWSSRDFLKWVKEKINNRR